MNDHVADLVLGVVFQVDVAVDVHHQLVVRVVLVVDQVAVAVLDVPSLLEQRLLRLLAVPLQLVGDRAALLQVALAHLPEFRLPLVVLEDHVGLSGGMAPLTFWRPPGLLDLVADPQLPHLIRLRDLAMENPVLLPVRRLSHAVDSALPPVRLERLVERPT